jgi:hypothetical protein
LAYATKTFPRSTWSTSTAETTKTFSKTELG